MLSTTIRSLRFNKTFGKIPGVLEVKVGGVIKSDRAIVDDSFDVGILVGVPGLGVELNNAKQPNPVEEPKS